MSTLSVHLPDSLYEQIKKLAKKEGISIDQLIVAAVEEKLSALEAAEYIEERAQRGSKERYDAALSKVSDVEPAEYDRL